MYELLAQKLWLEVHQNAPLFHFIQQIQSFSFAGFININPLSAEYIYTSKIGSILGHYHLLQQQSLSVYEQAIKYHILRLFHEINDMLWHIDPVLFPRIISL